MVDDEWHGLENYSKYELNKSGDIRNKKTKQILARQYSRYGYRVNTIVGDDGKIHYVRNHILVAKQFIENPHNYTVVNHIDGKRDNSSIDNLEWTSHKQNSNKGDALKRIASAHEIPVNEYTNKGEYIRTWKSRKRVARYYGVHSGAVSAVVDKDGRHLKGRIFKTYEGNCNNIYVDKFLGKEQDYSKYGEINEEDMYVPLEKKDILKDIYNRQMQTYVSQKQIRKDMEYLKHYILELQEKLEQLKSYDNEI